MSMEVEHHEPEFHRRRFSHKPLQKLPKLRSTPRGLGNFILKPKYQFSLRGNIKDRRDLRGGVIFETPSLCLYALSLMASSSSRVSLSFL